MRKDKVIQALKAPSTRLIHERDKFHKVYHIDSVRTGKPYQVILDWSKVDGILTLETELISFDPHEQPHPANQSRYLCYQVLAAAKKMAQDSGKRLNLCQSESDARKLLRLGGKLVKIQNLNGAICWATVR